MTAISLYTRVKGRQESESLGLSKTNPIMGDTPLLEEGKVNTIYLSLRER